MKRRIVGGLCLACLFLLGAGCAGMYRAPVKPPVGLLYSEFRAPLDDNFNRTEVSEKEGHATSCCLVLPYLSFAWDSTMVQKAAANGGLKEVYYADYELKNILGIYSEFTVHAYGK